MDQAWIAEERRLWDAMFLFYPVDGTKKNEVLLRKLKRKHPEVKREEQMKRLGLITEAQAVSRSWRAYDSWISH